MRNRWQGHGPKSMGLEPVGGVFAPQRFTGYILLSLNGVIFMRVFLALAITFGCGVMVTGCSPKSSAPSPVIMAKAPAEISSLVGVWDVALHFDPTQPPSATVLEIISEDAGALTGSFYGTEFEVARVVSFEGEIRLSFVTSDGSGPYASAGRLLPDGSLSGQTLSTGRSFLMAWTAEKQG